jgi:hypothetical protein
LPPITTSCIWLHRNAYFGWRGRWATSWNENEIALQSDVCRPGKIGYKQGNQWESAGS